MLQHLKQTLSGLNPERSKGRLLHFDRVRGFDSYAGECRASFGGAGSVVPNAEALAELRDRGVTRVDAMEAQLAAALREQVLALPAATRRFENEDYGEQFVVPEDLETTILRAVLPPHLTALIEHYFGSHFHIYNAHITRLPPRAPSKRSLLWHCDSGPSQHLKLLVYFENSETSGGNTAFLDRRASDGFLEQGYTFGPLRRRRDDLSGLARRLDIRFEPRTWPLMAGQGLLFEPSRVLHRGVIPDRGARHIVTLLLLPSPIPWPQALEEQGVLGRALGLGFRFPEQASEVLNRLRR